MNKSIIGVVLTMCLLSSVTAQQKFQKLTGAQIQARFGGMELTDESHWGEVLDRNGTLRIYSMGHKSIGNGEFRTINSVSSMAKLGGGCYEVWLSGNKVELRNKDSSLPLKGVLQKPTDR